MAIEKDYEFVTALPGAGYQLLWMSDKEIIDQSPVIGFMVYRFPTLDKQAWVTTIYPATAEQLFDLDAQSYALLRPDGKVDVPDTETFESIDAFRASLTTALEAEKP